MIKFNSQIEYGPTIQKQFTTDEIKNEPMLFQCDLEHALKFGGPITTLFIANLLKSPKFCIRAKRDIEILIDSRVHMLMPNWYPCIPGYHHDLIPRSRSDGQPNYHNPEYYSNHCLMLVNGDIAPTEFAIGEIELPEVPLGETIYKVWHPLVEQSNLKKVTCPSNQLVFFDWQTFHTGTKAVKNGWRFFIRASICHTEKPKNEIRRQVQVYLENPMEGW